MGKPADARDEHEVKVILKVLEQAEELAQDLDERLRIQVPTQQVGERRIVLVDQDHGLGLELTFKFMQQVFQEPDGRHRIGIRGRWRKPDETSFGPRFNAG